MKRNNIFFASLLFCFTISTFSVFSKAKKELVDKVIVKVNGACIFHSDLTRIQIANGGTPFTLDELIDYELYYQKSADRNFLPKLDDVNKQISALKIQNGLDGLTDEEFNAELKREGFTLQEYREQMGRMLAVEKLKHAEFSERIVVTSQEVEDYCEKNPEWDEEKYNIMSCVLPKTAVNSDGKLIENSYDNFSWRDFGWINKKDLSDRLAFVSDMKEGEVSDPIKNGEQYQVIKLVKRSERKLKTLSERYSDIENILRIEKKEKFGSEFGKELREKASIVYLT